MKIVVAVKQVAAVDEDFELSEGETQVDPDFLEWELNEWDSFALEAAMLLCEDGRGGAHEIVAVTVGEEQAEEGLLACLAKGAHRAVRVWDDALQDADALAVARVLAAAVERESPDLVLCGAQSSDSAYGATGVAMAGYLGLPHVAVVNRLQFDEASATAKVWRELEGGLVEVLTVNTPATLTVQTGINEPRYATLRAIKQARDKPLDVLGLSDLGLDVSTVQAAAGSRVVALEHPAPTRSAEMLEGAPDTIAARIVEIVRDRMSG